MSEELSPPAREWSAQERDARQSELGQALREASPSPEQVRQHAERLKQFALAWLGPHSPGDFVEVNGRRGRIIQADEHGLLLATDYRSYWFPRPGVEWIAAAERFAGPNTVVPEGPPQMTPPPQIPLRGSVEVLPE